MPDVSVETIGSPAAASAVLTNPRRPSCSFMRVSFVTGALFHDATSWELESHAEAHAQAVIDELEVVDVLLALLVLEEVGEVVADLELGPSAPAVDEPGVGVRLGLLQKDRPALLAPAVDLGQTATRGAQPQQPVIAQRVTPA